MPNWLVEFMPILILLVVVTIVLSRLPKVEGVDHSKEYRIRRVMNWLPLGLTYAFLYMGRYNIKVSQHAFGDLNLLGTDKLSECAPGAMSACTPLMANADFATIFLVGTWVYGCSFIVNGPLTDRMGGKFSILMGAGGSAFANLLMGFATVKALDPANGQYYRDNFTMIMSCLYGVNMYFQSFGAVAIVKCNAPWFHVRERGVFGAIFGILISLGIYFAFDVGYMIISKDDFNLPLQFLFFIPTILLAIFWVLDFFIVKNSPGEAGLTDFDTADASSGDDGPQLGAVAVFKMMMNNPVIITIACIEFCSGFLRQAIMQWYRTFAKQTDGILGLKGDFVYDNWGLLLCCAGIMGGVFAGTLSDRVFQSRRGPVAGILYMFMLGGGLVMTGLFYGGTYSAIGWLVIFMSMSIIGVHGMLSGTASMDFGGKKNVGVAVGIIDGFVYAGTGFMSLVYMYILPDDTILPGETTSAAANPENWIAWPISMLPIAFIGLYLSRKIWNAKPKGKGAPKEDTA
jgi:OPA family glycerol-3-phosphate transporter-like MFS transporter